MTPLEDRLARIEGHLEEIRTLVARLVAARETGIDPQELLADLEAGPQPHTSSEVPAPPVEWENDDPLTAAHTTASQWAAAGRTEDLSEFDLSNSNLRGVDLKEARLARANLSRVDLNSARLGRADLSGADISRAQLARADLSRANLSETNAQYANFSYAKLEGANLRHANLTRANLQGANLTGADLGGAQLAKCNLARANLRETAITHRQLASASSLEGATMPDGRIFDGNMEPHLTQRG